MRQSWAAKLGGLALVAVASALAGEAPGQTPQPAAMASPEPAAIEALARQAMLSVYFHARYVNADWLPAEFRPMPLEEAAGVLLRDGHPFAESRRRRAMARLFAAPPHPARRAALGRLQAPLAELENRLEARRAVAPAPELLEPGSSALVGEVVAILEELAGPSIPDCERTFPTTQISFSHTSWESTAIGSLTVQRGIEEMRPILDPQNWDVCGSKYFQASYVALPSGPIDPQGNAERQPNRPAAGSLWSDVLFEHFVFGVGAVQLGSFRTLLDVESKPGAGSHQVAFSLRKSVHSRIGPVARNGGIVVDEGWAKAAASGAAGTDVEAKKVLKFANWGGGALDFALNLWVGVFLEVVADEAYEGVCCQVSD